MLFPWLQSWIERNPQLWREGKGRLTRRNGLVAVVLSLLSQSAILITSWRQYDSITHLMRMRGESGEDLATTWQFMWFNMFQTLTWLGFSLLLLLGSYLLVRDIAREDRRGTLTFLRLSPQSSHSILLGKLLGVPLLLYLAIALVIPLHWCAAIYAGLSVLCVFSIYLLIIAGCACFYSFALLYALGWGAKARTWYLMFPALIVNLVLPFTGKVFINLFQPGASTSTIAMGMLLIPTLSLVLLGIITNHCWQIAIQFFRHPPLHH